MAIPKFNKYGLLPKGIHTCPIDEIKKRLGTINDHREERWKGFIKYFEKLKEADVAECIYIDGSFVTDKPNPTDIDLVVEVKEKTLKKPDSDLAKELFNNLNNQVIYRVHVFLHINNQPASKNDLREYFQYVKPQAAKKRGMTVNQNPEREFHKGILKVIL